MSIFYELISEFKVNIIPWKSLVLGIAAICSIIGIFTIKPIGIGYGLYILLILGCWLLFIIVYTVFVFIKKTYDFSRGKIGKTMKLIHYLMKELDNNNPVLSEMDDQFKNIHANACNEIAIYLTKLKKKKCSVSIKLIKDRKTKIDPNLELYNLCRDIHSQNRDTDNYKSRPHKIINNTCFVHVFGQLLDHNDDYYLNSNIQKTENYNNSSTLAYSEKNDLTKLPYRSELVLPIVPLSVSRRKTDHLVGFLCADSSSCHAFNNHFDVMLLKCMADQMYDIINNWFKVQEESNHGS